MSSKPISTLVNSILLVTLTFFAGCGGQGDQPATAATPSEVDRLRQTLSAYAESGVLDSGAETIGDAIETLPVDDQLRSELNAKLGELMSSRNAKKVQSIAGEMIELLPNEGAATEG